MSDRLKIVKKESAAGQRNALLDLWRSLCVCAMVVYHLLWDLAAFGRCPQPPLLAAYFIGGSFILISGAAVGFSRNPIRRGFAVFCAGLAVSIVTTLLHMPVRFGILQLLGVCMILWGLLGNRAEAIPASWRIPVCLLLFAGTWRLTCAVTVEIPLLYPLGLKSPEFYSADYYPIFPWLFLFLAGTGLGKRFSRTGQQIPVPGWLCAPGRYSLMIYLLHQPLLYGICRLMFH